MSTVAILLPLSGRCNLLVTIVTNWMPFGLYSLHNPLDLMLYCRNPRHQLQLIFLWINLVIFDHSGADAGQRGWCWTVSFHRLSNGALIKSMVYFSITVDSRYYDTAGIRKMYQYIQTIDITSLNFHCLGIVGIQIWCRNKQYFAITDIVITRDHCIQLDPFAFHPTNFYFDNC